MASNQRTYPNIYFSWYNDDSRLALVSKNTESTGGEGTTELYDTWQGQGDLDGTITGITKDGTTYTATTSDNHNLEYDTDSSSGDRITISGTINFNDTYTIKAVPTSRTFKFVDADAPDAETGLSGAKFVVKFINDGIRVTFYSKYEETDDITNDLYADLGVDTGMQTSLLYYVKARLYEDSGDMEKAQYFRKLYYREMKQYPSKRTGVRILSVPNL